MRAADVMVRHMVAIRSDAAIRDAVRFMIEHGTSGLPVVDAKENLTGIISEGDLTRRAKVEPRRERGLGRTDREEAGCMQNALF